MAEPLRQLKLAAAVGTPSLDFRQYVELARRAEQAKFDALVVHDTLRLEPTAVLAALATATSQLGLIAAATTANNEPYNIARRFAAIDHISGGRAGWYLVEGDEDHARAAEFYDVVAGLWDSWEDGALLRDKASGIYMDRDKIHFLDHVGTHFKVKGPLNVTRSPQGWPVVVQDAPSEAACALAARTADVILTAQTALDAAQAFYADVKARAARHGRPPDDIKIMPVVAPAIDRAPPAIADELETWLARAAADGFMVTCDEPQAFAAFTRHVVPELQRRGSFRTAYEGATLRANLGLRVPENRHTRARRGPGAAAS